MWAAQFSMVVRPGARNAGCLGAAPQRQPWSDSIILSPFLFCLFVLGSPGSLMESDTTSPRRGMTFITPFCCCKWRGYLALSPIGGPCHLGRPLRLVPLESTPRLVVSAAREPQTWAAGPRLRVSRTALSSLFLFQRVAGRFLQTCSLFMSLTLGSWPLLTAGLDGALVNIRPILPPQPPSEWGRMGPLCSAPAKEAKWLVIAAGMHPWEWRGRICFSGI